MIIELVAGTYGMGMSLAPLLQARRMRQRRSSQDVSLPYLATLLVGFALYLLYGVSISNRLLIATNAVSVIVTASTLLVAWSLRHDLGAEAGRDDVGPSVGPRPEARPAVRRERATDLECGGP